MTSPAKNKLTPFEVQVIENLTLTNKKLEKVIALLVSNQLLEECISPDSEPREAEDMARIVSESYSAGLCLADELVNRSKQYDYQKSEFFVDSEDEEIVEEVNAHQEDSEDEEPPNRGAVFSKF